MKKHSQHFFYLVIALVVCLASCRKDDHEPVDNTFPANTTRVTVAGRVLNFFNTPLQYAQVTLGGITVLTDSAGFYALNNVSINSERDVMVVNCYAYQPSYLGVTPGKGVQYMNVVMQSVHSAGFMNANGATINMTGGGSLIFPANAIVNANGTPHTGLVNMYYFVVDNSDSLYRFRFPGYDHMAIDNQGNEKVFSTYSNVYVKLFSGNTELKIDSTKTVTLSLPIPASQQATAPATTSFCSFNTANATWNEELTANRVGNEYRANVSHFSFWGCGSLHSPAFLTGRVLDCNNQPLPNTMVFFDYDNFTNTDNNGVFIKKVPSGITIPVIVPPAANGVYSQTITVTPISLGQTHDMGDIVLQCPSYLSGQLLNCNGTGVSGLVQVSYGGMCTGIYAINGTFNLPVAANTNVYIRIITTQKVVRLNAVTAATNQTLALGNIDCCNNPDSSNIVTLNGSGYVNQSFVPDIDITQSKAQFRATTGMTFFEMEGSTMQGNLVQILGYFVGSGPGSYTCDASMTNYVRIDVMDQVAHDGEQYTSEPSAANVTINVTTYDPENGRFKATITGTLISSPAQGPSGYVPVTITASIDLPRIPNLANVGPNNLTADGDGFLNLPINFPACSQNSYAFGYVAGNYQSTEQATVLKFAGCLDGPSGFGGRLMFKGNGPGTYTAPNDFYTTSFHIRLVANGLTTKIYTEIVSGTLNITQYNPAGGLISGTFSGVFKRTDATGTYTVNVTNGHVSCWHYPDQ